MLDSNYSELLRILGNSGGDTTIEYDSPYSIALAILEANGVDTSTKKYDSLYSILEEIEEMGGGQEEKFTFSITTDSANTVVINGEEQTSVEVLGGDEITWSVSRTGYVTQTGSWIMRREDKSVNVTLVANQYTFTINTSSDNTVVINGSERTSITADYGTTINWSVSREHYVTQSGTTTLTADTTENITLVLQQFTYTIITDPANRTIINGEVRTTFTGDYGTLISWGVDRTGYVYQSGNFYLTEDTTRTVTLVLETHTFTIVPTPNDATVTINGQTTSSVTVDYGTAISWSVAKTNYTTQTGSVASLTADTTETVTLVPVNYTLTFAVTPNDATIAVNGTTLSGTTYTGAYGSTISYEISKTDYETVTGTKTITQDETITVVLEEASNDLTFEVVTPGNILWKSYNSNGRSIRTIEYSKNGGEWTSITSTSAGTAIPVVANDKVKFRGSLSDVGTWHSSTSTFQNSFFSQSDGATFYVYGDVTDLLGSSWKTNLVANALRGLFKDCTGALSHSTKDILLPSTGLNTECYRELFSGCTGITRLPTLPATTLANSCYSNMFRGCTGITSIPNNYLPVTTLVQYCYQAMFMNCSNLVSVPSNLLPATTLANSCYSNMFYATGITSLPTLPATTLANNCYSGMFSHTGITSIPNNYLPATTLANNCYDSMFLNCRNLASVPSNLLPATTLANNCYQQMFYGCSSLSTGPNLPSTNGLAAYCYHSMFRESGLTSTPTISATELPALGNDSTMQYMFYGCTSLQSAELNFLTAGATNCAYMFQGCSSLSYIKCICATDPSTTNYTYNWVQGVAASGAFVKHPDITWPRGNSGIPSGWTLTNAPGVKIQPDVIDGTITINGVTSSDGVYLGDQGDTVTYSVSKSGYQTTSGTTTIGSSFTTIDVHMREPGVDNDYLNMEVVTPGNVVFEITGDWPSETTRTLEYSKDGGSTWNTATATRTTPVTIPVSAGDHLLWRGSDTVIHGSSQYQLEKIGFNTTGGATIYAYGELDSLVVPDTSNSYVYYRFATLFFGCSGLLSHPTKHIILRTFKPGRTNQQSMASYDLLFINCTSLTTSPVVIEVSQMGQAEFSRMFYGCSSLTTAPALPATTLAQSCYSEMFRGCSSLTTAPALPATTLVQGCYREMFSGCSSLTTAPALPATVLTNNCYTEMFKGCSSLTTAPALPATTLATGCYDNMFVNCTGLTATPVLPATTLTTECYIAMFYKCSSLNEVTCLATDISASNCIADWLKNTAASGTLYKDPNMTDWVVGTNVPSGWTISDYTA